MRLRAKHANDVWSYGFVAKRTSDGKAIRMLNIIEEFTRECLVIHVARRITAYDVLKQLAKMFFMRGTPNFICPENGSEFVAEVVREWLGWFGTDTLFIEPGSPWENGYIESFSGKLRY